MNANIVKNPPKALVFDVFGTCVDWRGSIIREGRALNRVRGWTIDWEGLVDAWRGAYQPNMQKVRTGELPWTMLDQLHMMALKTLLPRFLNGTPRKALVGADLQLINAMWHRLKAWPEAVAGLQRIKRKHIIGTMSNGNVALLTNMAKNAGLPWDLVLSAELFQHYKPDAETYLGAARLLALPYSQHPFGNQASAHAGERPLALRPELAIGLPLSRMKRSQALGYGSSSCWKTGEIECRRIVQQK